MTRHSKNCTASAVYSAHERSKDSRTSGYGTQRARLGRDSAREFDCCALTLQPCRTPVVTEEGVLFDREAILEYIVGRKREIARQLKEWSRQQDREKEDLARVAQAEKEAQEARFATANGVQVTKGEASGSQGFRTGTPSLLRGEGPRKAALPSFWIPDLTPDSKETKKKKPDEKVRCPVTGKPLRLKDLVEVNFEPVPAASNTAVAFKGSGGRYRCAVTGDLLNNNSALVVLRPSGLVCTEEAFERLVRPDMREPRSGKALKDKDVIRLQRGASGFAASGLKLKAEKAGPVMQ